MSARQWPPTDGGPSSSPGAEAPAEEAAAIPRALLDAVAAPLLARCTFPQGGGALWCAVSGGADSTALLALAVAAGCAAAAFHVDHGLRQGSPAEGILVAMNAQRLGARFAGSRVRIAAGPNLEERARQARLSALPPGAATGHTADDQAETVMLNMLRGAGASGLAGMRPGPRHPILALRREETVAVCRRLGLEFVDDPTNAERTQRRNRVRHELLPLCAAIADRDVAAVLARQARLFADDADLLDALSTRIDPSSTAQLNAAPPPLARRAVRRWLQGSGPHPPSAAEVERVLSVARNEILATEVAGGRRVARRRGRLSVVGPLRLESDAGDSASRADDGQTSMSVTRA